MLSIPPATTTSASPAFTAWAASITAFNPEPQTLLTVTAPTSTGIPAATAACRAGAMPLPAWTTSPMMTSSIWAGSTPARRMASRMATAPSWGAGRGESAPSSFPMGVRAAPTITGSRPSLRMAIPP